jgi:hypothetical protein
MKSGLVIVSVVAIAIVGAAIGLVVYAGNMEAPKETVEVTIPDSTFER